MRTFAKCEVTSVSHAIGMGIENTSPPTKITGIETNLCNLEFRNLEGQPQKLPILGVTWHLALFQHKIRYVLPMYEGFHRLICVFKVL
jgi:hypothetical protein